MKYDSKSNRARTVAAARLAVELGKAQFVHLTPRQVNHPCKEVVYGILVPGCGSIRIYTSIGADGRLRKAGKDAIRVQGFTARKVGAHWQRRRVFSKRVYRAGTCVGIARRTIQAARAAWVSVRKEAT